MVTEVATGLCVLAVGLVDRGLRRVTCVPARRPGLLLEAVVDEHREASERHRRRDATPEAELRLTLAPVVLLDVVLDPVVDPVGTSVSSTRVVVGAVVVVGADVVVVSAWGVTDNVPYT
mgnify:CR=1 FL=1